MAAAPQLVHIHRSSRRFDLLPNPAQRRRLRLASAAAQPKPLAQIQVHQALVLEYVLVHLPIGFQE